MIIHADASVRHFGVILLHLINRKKLYELVLSKAGTKRMKRRSVMFFYIIYNVTYQCNV